MAQTAAHQRDEECGEQGSRGSHGTFVWNELMTRDVERAKAFYQETIGWSFEPMQMPGGGTYWCAVVQGKPVAGIFSIDAPEFDWRAGELDVLSRGRRRG